MQTFVVKLASGIAALVASICLSVCNLSSDTDAAVSTAAAASSVAGLRMTMTLFPVAGLLVAVWVFLKKYILTDEKVEELSAEIRARRG